MTRKATHGSALRPVRSPCLSVGLSSPLRPHQLTVIAFKGSGFSGRGGPARRLTQGAWDPYGPNRRAHAVTGGRRGAPAGWVPGNRVRGRFLRGWLVRRGCVRFRAVPRSARLRAAPVRYLRGRVGFLN